MRSRTKVLPRLAHSSPFPAGDSSVDSTYLTRRGPRFNSQQQTNETSSLFPLACSSASSDSLLIFPPHGSGPTSLLFLKQAHLLPPEERSFRVCQEHQLSIKICFPGLRHYSHVPNKGARQDLHIKTLPKNPERFKI